MKFMVTIAWWQVNFLHCSSQTNFFVAHTSTVLFFPQRIISHGFKPLPPVNPTARTLIFLPFNVDQLRTTKSSTFSCPEAAMERCAIFRNPSLDWLKGAVLRSKILRRWLIVVCKSHERNLIKGHNLHNFFPFLPFLSCVYWAEQRGFNHSL